MEEEALKLKRRQEIIDYYERIRNQQKLEGNYDVNRNGNVAYDSSINIRNVINFDEQPKDASWKYEHDKTLV